MTACIGADKFDGAIKQYVADILHPDESKKKGTVAGTPFSRENLTKKKLKGASPDVNMYATLGNPWITGVPDLVATVAGLDMESAQTILGDVTAAMTKALSPELKTFDGMLIPGVLGSNADKVKLQRANVTKVKKLAAYRIGHAMLAADDAEHHRVPSPWRDQVYQVVFPEKDGSFKHEQCTWQVML